ncbi:diacylglycerol kinase, partial [Candidatus Roizmanbacteria bacterium CG_4_8_14_3_um_filter_36_12]
IGGAQIYSLAIKYTDKLYLTLVDKDYPEADVFFPDYSEFKMVKEEKHQDKKYSYKFVEFIK